MSSLSALLGPPVQIAYAVDDVDAAVNHWTSAFGAGPFLVRRHIELASVLVRGVPSTFDHSSAYGQWGDVMIELVQEHLSAGSEPISVRRGLHHCAFFVDDLGSARARLAEDGYPEVLWAKVANSSTEFGFFDARNDLGHLVEIYEGTPRMRDFYAHIRSLALGARGDDQPHQNDAAITT